MTADEHSQPFRLQIAAYDQSYADDVRGITAGLKRRRIVVRLHGDVNSLPKSNESDALFG